MYRFLAFGTVQGSKVSGMCARCGTDGRACALDFTVENEARFQYLGWYPAEALDGGLVSVGAVR